MTALMSVEPAKTEFNIPLSSKDWKCLLTNIYYEARGEPILGQIAVARVTLNRVGLFAPSVCEVVFQKNQFSWTNQISLRKHAFAGILPPITPEIMLAAYSAFFYDSPALYFHSIRINPGWSKHFNYLETINNHVFYS